MIEVKKLKFTYPGNSEPTIRTIDFTIPRGEIFGFLGPNGAGKTTIFDMVVGLCQPDQGKIFLNKEDITLLPMYK
ncbi:ATP-binding cassette domain-containing protein, partial [candidate division KSB1 bacterium]|nr:ATP-binding cassette domain-containing protein [candidate division KSB1 bacterium]